MSSAACTKARGADTRGALAARLRPLGLALQPQQREVDKLLIQASAHADVMLRSCDRVA